MDKDPDSEDEDQSTAGWCGFASGSTSMVVPEEEEQPLNSSHDARDWSAGPPKNPARRDLLRTRREYRDWLLGHFPILSDTENPWRRCTNVVLLPFMALCFCGLTTVTLIGFFCGNPQWTRREWDYQGRLCGIHTLLDERPLLYWPKAYEVQSPVCVARCPTVEDVANGKTVKLPRADQINLVSSDGGSRIRVSQALWVAQVPLYSTLPVFGRFCLPAPTTPLPTGLDVAQTGLAGGSSATLGPLAKDSLLATLQSSHGQVSAQLRRWIGGVGNAWLLLVGVLLLFVLLGLLSAVLAHTCPVIVCWIALLCLAIGTIGGGSYLVAAGVVQSNDFAITTMNSLQPRLAQALGVILVVSGLLVTAVAMLLRASLGYASSTTSIVTTLLLSSEPALAQVIWVPVVVAICQVLLCLLWVQVLPYLASVASITWPSVPPPGSPWWNATNVDITTLPTAPAPVFPGGPAILTMGRKVEFSSVCPVLVLGSLLFLRLGLKLVEATGHFVIGYICALWYFTEPSPTTGRRPLPKCPLKDAFAVACCLHPGSISCAALLHTLTPATSCRISMQIACALLIPWRPPRPVDKGGDKPLPPEGCAVKVAYAAQQLQTLFSPAVLTEVALRAQPFWSSASRVSSTMPLALPAVQKLFGLPSLLGIVVSASLSFGAGACVLASLSSQQSLSLKYSETPLGVAILLWALAYPAVSAWSLFYTATSDSLLHCFASDDSENRDFQLDLAPGEKAVQHIPARVSVDASFALWSSPMTPPTVRAWIFKVSSSLKSQDVNRRQVTPMKDNAMVKEIIEPQEDARE
eukprot:gnl/MRDRNA2_/MRDRNA2_25163_c0_seq1.p1 gnl/MRDRNA2_/MRDRNA2_25163_c0~~gnl/MRDRNA2_/MRDRNA2_25163_c0_seq1.p1  ORF type:complete len:805 (+),score=96.00 gnl/MRDRNA2_/MRDRNA2_25163_c0_seq1:88-2502(+)